MSYVFKYNLSLSTGRPVYCILNTLYTCTPAYYYIHLLAPRTYGITHHTSALYYHTIFCIDRSVRDVETT
jgi:hypothetical protein